MKLASVALVLLFFASCQKTLSTAGDSSVESIKAGTKISVPGQDILAAIEKIQKLKPARVQVLKGRIVCQVTAREVPPYRSTSQCTIHVDGKKQDVEYAEYIVDALNKAKPATRPNFSWSGSYEVNVVAGDFPPYKNEVTASVMLK